MKTVFIQAEKITNQNKNYIQVSFYQAIILLNTMSLLVIFIVGMKSLEYFINPLDYFIVH